VIIRPTSFGGATILGKHRVASVLVVEDVDILREGLVDFVEAQGCTAVGVGNGQEALEYLEAAPLRPKLILLDLKMPIMNGWELLNKLRQVEAFATIPLVIMSAHRHEMPGPAETAFSVLFMDKCWLSRYSTGILSRSVVTPPVDSPALGDRLRRRRRAPTKTPSPVGLGVGSSSEG